MIQAGTSTTDITPEQGEDLSGFAARAGKKTAGIHDRLFSRWLYLGHGPDRALISSNDILSLSRGFYQSLRGVVSEATGIAPRAVCVATSHTHSGPAPVRLRHCGRMSPGYVRTLKSRLGAAGAQAPRAPVPVRIGVAKTTASYAENRRDPAKGAVDRDLFVVAVDHARTGAPVATVINYACHPVVMGSGNLYVSADFPGPLQTRVEEATGAPCLFLNGACGDLNPVEAHAVDFAVAERMGGGLADLALAARREAAWLDDATPSHRTVQIALPVRRPKSPEELDARQRQAIEAFSLPPDLFSDRIALWKRQLADGTYPAHITIEITLLALGPELALIFIPGELFTEIGMAIKRMSPFRHTLVCGFSNGTVGYLPTRRAFELGGYEPYVANLFYDYPEFDPSLEDVILEKVALLFRDRK